MSLNDLVRIQEERDRKEKNLYKIVYEKITTNINNIGLSGGVNCYYTIPPFIIGYPLINIPQTLEYVVQKLIKKGFYVLLVPGTVDTIFISWEISLQQKKRKNAEINKKHKKLESKISFAIDEEINKRNDNFLTTLANTKLKIKK